MRSIVLASTSPYRRQLMQQLQLPFVADSPRFQEVKMPGVAPELLVKHLALSKARSLTDTYEDSLIIGSDQVFVDPRGTILGKPNSLDKALEQLRAMNGKTHTFYTGLAVIDSASGECLNDFATYQVTLRKLTDNQLRDYLVREKPFDCAGSFRIEGLGISLMASMAGADYSTLIGLPLIKLIDMLEYFKIQVLRP